MKRVCKGAMRTGSSLRDAVGRDRGSLIRVAAEEVVPDGGEAGWGVIDEDLRDWM